MATILSLALKVNADASGVVKNLTPAERALENIGKQAAKATSVFDEFAGTSAAAANAQSNASKSLSDLSESLKRGEISAKEFAARYGELTDEINKEAAAFRRAAEITKANISPLERYDAAVTELDEQLRAGRISQETYNRALEKAQGDLNRTSVAIEKTDKSMESLVRNTRIIASIEIGKLFVGGVQAIGSAIRDVATRITSLVTSVNTSIDSLNDLSARTGIGVEALQGYALAAKLAGVDTEQFGTAVQKLAVNIGKATPGDALDKALKGINLSLADLRALSPEQQFSEIGAAISQLPTAADKAAAAVAIFGKQGAALAPLFREGAASIEELRARAERLGIIVSETQINNVAEMNDAFDLVRATIDGIIGQVIGNLAPAVTKVLEDLLRFVETYEDQTGAVGGTAFANAITDAFVTGSQLFLSILGKFTDVAKQVAAALGVDLRSDAEKRLAALEAQVAAGTAPQVALDPAGFATDIAPEFLAEMTALREQVAEEAKQSAFAAAQDFLTQFEQRVREARKPEIQIQTNIDETRERFDNFFNGIVDEQNAITGAMREYEAAVSAVVDPMNMTADEIKLIEQTQATVNSLIDQELAARNDAADAAIAQAEADKRRLTQLLQTNDAAAKIEADLQAVQREQARVSKELAAARQADNAAQANAAAARLAELDQLQASLETQRQTLEQGVGQGLQAVFEERLAQIEQEKQAEQQAKAAVFQLEVDANQRVNEFIAQRTQAEIAGAEQAAARRQQAAFNIEAIEQRIALERQSLEAAREQNDLKAARSAVQRIDLLKDALSVEQQIADGRAEELQKQQQLIENQQQFQRQQQAAAQAYQQQQQQAQQAYAQQQARIFEEQRKAAEAEAKRQEERLAKLNTLGSKVITGTDIRTQAGASLVLNLAANAQDPQLIEARLQTKYLQSISLGIGQAASNYFNAPVAIVGYSRFQGDTPRG